MRGLGKSLGQKTSGSATPWAKTRAGSLTTARITQEIGLLIKSTFSGVLVVSSWAGLWSCWLQVKSSNLALLGRFVETIFLSSKRKCFRQVETCVCRKQAEAYFFPCMTCSLFQPRFYFKGFSKRVAPWTLLQRLLFERSNSSKVSEPAQQSC